MKAALFDAIVAAGRHKRPVATVTDLNDGAQALVTADSVTGSLSLDAAETAEARAMLAGEASGLLRDAASPGGDGPRLFVHVYALPRRLVIVGAVHIAQALAPMARLAGYAVQVIDPRGAFATHARFPDCDLQVAWPDDVLRHSPPDSGTAIAVLSHDPKIDDPALRIACPGPAFYIGALGSRRTHAKRRERLAAEGLAAAQLDRIHAPIGLAIAARSPAEIAVSILAEITAVRRGGVPVAGPVAGPQAASVTPATTS